MLLHTFDKPYAGKTHLTHMTFHKGKEVYQMQPVITIYFQQQGDISIALQNAIEELPDGFTISNEHHDHPMAHVGGPNMEGYPPHIHIGSSMLQKTAEKKGDFFTMLIEQGYLVQADKAILLSFFYG